jgi:hypothetical protein
MKKFGILLVIIVFMFDCKGQTSKETGGRKQALQNITQKNKTNPEVKVRVNNTYDDKGNIVRYDSVYSYVYRYPNGKVMERNADSVIQEFQRTISEDFSSRFNQDFYNNLFPNDSTLSLNFPDKDYFSRQFRNESEQFERMMNELDSIKNDFMRNYYKAQPGEYAEHRHEQKL